MRFASCGLILTLFLAAAALAEVVNSHSQHDLSRRDNCLNCFSGHSAAGSSPHRSKSSSSHQSSPRPTKHPAGPFHSPSSSPTSSSRSHSSSSTPTSGDDRALMISTAGLSFRAGAPRLHLNWERVRKEVGKGTTLPLPQRQQRPHSPSPLSPRPTVAKVENLHFGSFRPATNGHHGKAKATSPPKATKAHTASTALPALRIGRPNGHRVHNGRAADKGKAVDKGKGKAIAVHRSSSSSDTSPETSTSRLHSRKSGDR